MTDDNSLHLPKVGEHQLRVLAPNLLELTLINTKPPGEAPVTGWNFVTADGQFQAPPLEEFDVRVEGKPVAVQAVGFKRRPVYAPLKQRDLRIANYLYLELRDAIPAGSSPRAVEVRNPGGKLWPAEVQFATQAGALRFSPAIHVNQVGYVPAFAKTAMVGYYLGSLGEMEVPAKAGFKLVNAAGKEVFSGPLKRRADVGYKYEPPPYRQVWEADFSQFRAPGEYRLVVPGLGASGPFRIDDGVAMSFARTYALGLYHQRCGTANEFPYTRHTHGACHLHPATVPLPETEFAFTWKKMAENAVDKKPNPRKTAPVITTNATSLLYPFAKRGKVDVAGGHHDAGDYSKYTINSAGLIHYLMFAVDAFEGVAGLDNLGLPESGDGISDVLQEARWETEFLAKMQDQDGGFYFLVYPRDRAYESHELPDAGDPQVVWPKNTAASAAAVAALAQTASSPWFKKHFPKDAARYLAQAERGWEFLTKAIGTHGKDGAYQRITHYGHEFMHDDELAWAACELFLATGKEEYHRAVMEAFDPADAGTRRWGWWRLYEGYGRVIRSYAFAARTGRLPLSRLDRQFLGKCQAEIMQAAEDHARRANESAYGTSFPQETKRMRAAGWYFSTERAFDLAAAYQIEPRPEWLEAILSNLNYEAGCNPVNVSYLTGLGWKRPREMVHQYAQNDRRALPPSGLPFGNVQAGFAYLAPYQKELGLLTFPSDGADRAPYPYYDRWGDSFNVSTEFVHLDQARALGTVAFLAAQTPLKSQAWKSARGTLAVASEVVMNEPVTVSFSVSGLDLKDAQVVWEARDLEPVFGGGKMTFTPVRHGPHWVEAEAVWPDGRRVFGAAEFNVTSPVITVKGQGNEQFTMEVWFDDELPAGAQPGAEGGDSWNWVSKNPAPFSGKVAHQSNLAAGAHQHSFNHAGAKLSVGAGDVLFAYVYLDPANPPSQIMLQWVASNWEHRAYWGANRLSNGKDNTPSRRHMGPLPPAGQWVRLEVPAKLVDLEGRTIKGMGFTLFDGRATWDLTGKLTPAVRAAGR